MKDIVELNPAFRDYAERSENVDKVLRQFKKDETFVTLKGWREEVSRKTKRFFHRGKLIAKRLFDC